MKVNFCLQYCIKILQFEEEFTRDIQRPKVVFNTKVPPSEMSRNSYKRPQNPLFWQNSAKRPLGWREILTNHVNNSFFDVVYNCKMSFCVILPSDLTPPLGGRPPPQLLTGLFSACHKNKNWKVISGIEVWIIVGTFKMPRKWRFNKGILYNLL